MQPQEHPLGNPVRNLKPKKQVVPLGYPALSQTKTEPFCFLSFLKKGWDESAPGLILRVDDAGQSDLQRECRQGLGFRV